jgi:hypothetical protein
MALSNIIVARVRRAADGGDDTFGAMFDPGYGTSVLTRSNLACNDSKTVTSVTGGFNGLTVNQYINITSTAGDWRCGWYRITAINSDTSITLEEKPVRETANATSGVGTVYPGVAYNCQSTAQLSLTDINVANNSTQTVTSVTGGFTAAMVSNCIRITGGGATAGYYVITGFTDTNTITVDRPPQTTTNGTGKVGGAAATINRLASNDNATGDKVPPGATIWVKGSGVVDPSTPDYTTTGFVRCLAGTSSYRVRIVGESGERPHYRSDGLVFLEATLWIIENMMFSASSNANGVHGILNLYGCTVRNCKIDQSNKTTLPGIRALYVSGGGGSSIIDCEIYGGTTSPTYDSGSPGINFDSSYGSVVQGCNIHHSKGEGIRMSADGSSSAVNNIVSACAGSGVELKGGAVGLNVVTGNIIDGNKRNGIMGIQSAFTASVIDNNIIANHDQATYGGLNVTSGTTDQNTNVPAFIGYNAFYNNTTHYIGVCASKKDIICTADPYTNRAGGDYTLNNTAGGGALLRDAGLPQAFPGLSSTNAYMPIGLLTTPAAGGSSGARLVGQSALVSV